jgi:hypothetical protein
MCSKSIRRLENKYRKDGGKGQGSAMEGGCNDLSIYFHFINSHHAGMK